jgi:hypothetical protein
VQRRSFLAFTLAARPLLAKRRVLDIVSIEKGKDPHPHGVDMYQGKIYRCDAGLSPAAKQSPRPYAGYIYRIEL